MIKKVVLAVMLLIATVFCAGYASTHYVASYSLEKQVHVVKNGETLWDISVAYMPQQARWDDVRGLMADIQTENGLTLGSRHNLVPGQRLVIPLHVKK